MTEYSYRFNEAEGWDAIKRNPDGTEEVLLNFRLIDEAMNYVAQLVGKPPGPPGTWFKK